MKARLIAAWSVGGVLALLLYPLRRIIPVALEPILGGTLDVPAIAAYVASIVLLGFFEGYRGFHLAFSPRVVARTIALLEQPTPLRVALAPAFSMGLFAATTKRLLVSWGVLVGVTILVVIVGRLDQPWRGAVDAGVVVGLGWGSLSIVLFAIRAAAGRPPAISADVSSS